MKLIPFIQPRSRGAVGSQPTASKSKSKRRTEGLCSSWELNHEPFWCEVTALPTDPSCCKSSRTCWCIFKHIYWGILHSHECLEPNSVVPDFTHRWWHTFFLLFPSKNINECGDAPTTVLFVDIKPPQITQREKNSASGWNPHCTDYLCIAGFAIRVKGFNWLSVDHQMWHVVWHLV